MTPEKAQALWEKLEQVLKAASEERPTYDVELTYDEICDIQNALCDYY